jgi:hypothetical protein
MFVSAEEVFANVKTMLSSYDSAGFINDPDLFRWTRDCVDKFGTYSYKDQSILLEIDGYKAAKPEDFKLIKDIFLCSLEDESGKETTTYKTYYGRDKIYTITDNFSTMCYDKCHVCHDDSETYIRRIVSSELTHTEEKVHLKGMTPLSINKRLTKDKCYKHCSNLKSTCKYSFDLTSTDIVTNFEKGFINLQYFALVVDEDGYPELLDDTKTLIAVEDYLIYKSLQKIWLNSDADVQIKMQYYEGKSRQSTADAINHSKLDTFRSLVEYAKKRKNYSNIFNIKGHSDAGIN